MKTFDFSLGKVHCNMSGGCDVTVQFREKVSPSKKYMESLWMVGFGASAFLAKIKIKQ